METPERLGVVYQRRVSEKYYTAVPLRQQALPKISSPDQKQCEYT
jgi:hypothetical protein